MIKPQPVFRNKRVERIVPEFCVDTGVLGDMYSYYTNNMHQINALTNGETYSNYALKLLKLLREKKIKLYVTNDVLLEFYRRRHFKNFINQKRFLEEMGFRRVSYSFTPKKVRNAHYNKRDELVDLYTDPLTEEEKQEILNSEYYNIEDESYLIRPAFDWENLTDARIMAEAAILGIPLITLNKHHFITRNRPDMIRYINSKVKGVSRYKTARPILPNEVFTMLEEGLYPGIYRYRRKELYAENYPLKSFAYCKKKTLDKNVIKQNRKLRRQKRAQYLKEKEYGN